MEKLSFRVVQTDASRKLKLGEHFATECPQGVNDLKGISFPHKLSRTSG